MRFIVVPKPASGGRTVLFEVIDTKPTGTTDGVRADRARIGQYADRLFADAIAATLEGASSVLDSICVGPKSSTTTGDF